MKKIFTLFAALAMVMSMSAAIQLRGTLSDWNTGLEFTGNPLSVTVNLEANTTYEFKVVVDGAWKGNAGTITDNITDWVFDNDANCQIKTQAAGEYTFTWNTNGNKLSVAYPALAPAVYKDITITVNIPYSLNGKTPKIYWWGADGVADAVWNEAPEMELASSWSTTKFSYTFEQIDAVRGINYLIICDGVQTNDLYTQKDVAIYFASNLPTIKVMGIDDDWNEGLETTISSDCKTADVMVQLPENTKTEFKLQVNGAWVGTNSVALTKENNTAPINGNAGNPTVTSDRAGGYIFSYSYVTKELTVIYPGDYTLDLGEMTPAFGWDGVELSDENYNTITIYNLVDEEYTYGDEFDVEASITDNGRDLNLTGKGSWTLADGVMTLVATNMVDEDNSVNYTINATALAPQEKTIVCNGDYKVDDYGFASALIFTATTEDEEFVQISITEYPEDEEGNQEPAFVEGEIDGEWFEAINSYNITDGEGDVKTLNVVAIDGAGNTYTITITATPRVTPSINIYNATFVEVNGDGELVFNVTYEGQAMICTCWESPMEPGTYGVMLSGEENEYSCYWGATLVQEDSHYTITALMTDWNEQEYNVMITTKANTATALDNVTSTVAPVKVIENNQLIIINNGVRYNVLGATVK